MQLYVIKKIKNDYDNNKSVNSVVKYINQWLYLIVHHMQIHKVIYVS